MLLCQTKLNYTVQTTTEVKPKKSTERGEDQSFAELCIAIT